MTVKKPDQNTVFQNNNMKIQKFLFFEVLYQNFLLAYLLQLISQQGKKVFYEQKILEALLLIKIKLRFNPFLILFEILERNKPILSIKFKKKLYKTKQKINVIPIFLNQYQQYKKVLS